MCPFTLELLTKKWRYPCINIAIVNNFLRLKDSFTGCVSVFFSLLLLCKDHDHIILDYIKNMVAIPSNSSYGVELKSIEEKLIAVSTSIVVHFNSLRL